MKFADKYTSFSDLSLSPEIRAILRATAYNQQVFDLEDYEEERYTTQSIKYDSEEKPRPNYQAFDELQGDYNNPRFASIQHQLGFDEEETALKFQLETWKTIFERLERRAETGKEQGLVISAPTGFGKTACFLGPIINSITDTVQERNSRHSTFGDTKDGAILVYPTRSLLHDQLSRVLEILHGIKEESEEMIPSVGVWFGDQPKEASQVFDGDYSTTRYHSGDAIFTNAQYWGDIQNNSLYIKEGNYHTYTIENAEGEELFNSAELLIARDPIRDRNPNILLTTLESLENIALKPHYDIVANADFFVFDEAHQYSGLRGSHAARVIRNIKRIRHHRTDTTQDASAVYISSSATIEDPEVFTRKLFGLHPDESTPADNQDSYSEDDLAVTRPAESDIDSENPDRQHYYFMLTPGEPDVASQFIQHTMMLGHSLLDDDPNEVETPDRSKVLAFVDSRSLLRNLQTRFINADSDTKLWQYHFNPGYPGDWGRLAEETNHIPIKQPLSHPLLVYSGSDRDIDQIRYSDLTFGTKYLEVGVDIQTLDYIVNYREPPSVSAFKQRAGRAGRKPGRDAHMFTLLSQYSGDTNFYYRADGFVESDITTPLNVENHVVEWMHDRYFEYYQTLSDVGEQHTWTQEEMLVIKKLFNDRLGWEEFYTLLSNPQEIFQELLDETPAVPNLITHSVGNAKDAINRVEEEIYSKEQDFAGSEIGLSELFLREDASRELVEQIYARLIVILEGFESVLQRAQDRGKETGDLATRVLQARERVEGIDEKADPTTRINEIKSVIDGLFEVYPSINDLSADVDNGEVNTEQFLELYQQTDEILEALEGGLIDETNKKRRCAYYLDRALDNIRDYDQIGYSPHGSLYAVKNLFRAGYYCEKALRVGREQDAVMMDDIWFVPPNYFEETGQYFQLVKADGKKELRSVDTLLSQYIPYNSEFMYGRAEEFEEADLLQVFQPNVKSKSGRLEFDFGAIEGSTQNGIFIPDRVNLKKIEDQSGFHGQKVVPYSQVNFELLSPEEEADSDQVSYGKVYASPHISTRVDPIENVPDSLSVDAGDISINSVAAQAWIEAVSLEITPTKGDSLSLDYDSDTIEQRIDRGNRKLGYSLETRAVSWDVSSIIEEVDFETLKLGRYKSNPDIPTEQIVVTTAAHLLTMLVADVAGINPQLLLYATEGGETPTSGTSDQTSDEYIAHVFEQTEGGQGIIDFFWESVQNRPERVLKSLYRFTRNPQVLNERLWARTDPTGKKRDIDWDVWEVLLTEVDLERLRNDDEEVRSEERERLLEIVNRALGYSDNKTLDRIADQTMATLEHLEQYYEELQDIEQVTKRDLFELKSALAEARIRNIAGNGGDFIPTRVKSEYSDIFDNIDDEGQIQTLFLSPDIDGCEANLQLKRKNFDYKQSEVLSNLVLEELEEWVVTRVSSSDEFEMIQKYGRLSARSNEEFAYFLDF